MKLMFAVVNGEDSSAVSAALTKAGFFATRLSSTGGLLRAGNTTFLLCVEDDRVDAAIAVIAEKSHKRKQFIPNSADFGLGAYQAIPVEVTVGGATIFVTDVERFEKL